MLSWQPNPTWHFMPLMQLSQHRLQNFRPNTVLATLSIISWLSTTLKIQPKCSTTFSCCILKQSSFHNLTFRTPHHSTLSPAYHYQKDERAQTRNFRTLLSPTIEVVLIPPLYLLIFFTLCSVFRAKKKKQANWKHLEGGLIPSTSKEAS